MKNMNLKATVGLAACMLAAPAMYASTTVNMTGCLARGARTHEYTATDNTGKTFGLIAQQGAGVNIKKHVGQEVMVTGTLAKAGRERHEATKTGTPVYDEYVRVYQIKRVSPSCQ